MLTYSAARQPTPADATVRLPARALPALASGAFEPAALTELGVEVDGDRSVLDRLFGVLDSPDPDFPIVTRPGRGRRRSATDTPAFVADRRRFGGDVVQRGRRFGGW